MESQPQTWNLDAVTAEQQYPRGYTLATKPANNWLPYGGMVPSSSSRTGGDSSLPVFDHMPHFREAQRSSELRNMWTPSTKQDIPFTSLNPISEFQDDQLRTPYGLYGVQTRRVGDMRYDLVAKEPYLPDPRRHYQTEPNMLGVPSEPASIDHEPVKFGRFNPARNGDRSLPSKSAFTGAGGSGGGQPTFQSAQLMARPSSQLRGGDASAIGYLGAASDVAGLPGGQPIAAKVSNTARQPRRYDAQDKVGAESAQHPWIPGGGGVDMPQVQFPRSITYQNSAGVPRTQTKRATFTQQSFVAGNPGATASGGQAAQPAVFENKQRMPKPRVFTNQFSSKQPQLSTFVVS